MPKPRFTIGTTVMCNFGRAVGSLAESSQPTTASGTGRSGRRTLSSPLEEDSTSSASKRRRCCRLATIEDTRIVETLDALAPCPVTPRTAIKPSSSERTKLRNGAPRSIHDYHWALSLLQPPSASLVKCRTLQPTLPSAERNGLGVTHHVVDLGRITVGESLELNQPSSPCSSRLWRRARRRTPSPRPPLSDDGRLKGTSRSTSRHRIPGRVHRGETTAWDDNAVVVIGSNLFSVSGISPTDFDLRIFHQKEEQLELRQRVSSRRVADLAAMGSGEPHNRETCDRMCTTLRRLRALLEEYPSLIMENGKQLEAFT